MNKYKRGDILEGKVFNRYLKNSDGSLRETWYSSIDTYNKANEYYREYQKRNPEQRRESSKRYRDKNRDSINHRKKQSRINSPELDRNYHIEWEKKQDVTYHIRRMLNAAKGRALKKGIQFELQVEDIHIPLSCPILGIPIFFNKWTGVSGAKPDSISLDRIDSSKGYTKDNIMIISWKANNLKSNGSITDLEKIVAYMKANLINPV